MILRCNSCKVHSVKGVKCHEQGCPDAWRDSIRTCPWCGNEFSPSHKDHCFCNVVCAGSYNDT